MLRPSSAPVTQMPTRPGLATKPTVHGGRVLPQSMTTRESIPGPASPASHHSYAARNRPAIPVGWPVFPTRRSDPCPGLSCSRLSFLGVPVESRQYAPARGSRRLALKTAYRYDQGLSSGSFLQRLALIDEVRPALAAPGPIPWPRIARTRGQSPAPPPDLAASALLPRLPSPRAAAESLPPCDCQGPAGNSPPPVCRARFRLASAPDVPTVPSTLIYFSNLSANDPE